MNYFLRLPSHFLVGPSAGEESGSASASAMLRSVGPLTRMLMNWHKNVATNQQSLTVVPHQAMGQRTNGKCSTIGKSHAVF